MGGEAGPRAAPGEACGRPLAVRVVVAGDDEALEAGGGANAPRLPAESAAAATVSGMRGDQRQHRLDALAHQQRAVRRRYCRSARPDRGRGRAPCAAGPRSALAGRRRIEPGPVDAGNGPRRRHRSRRRPAPAGGAWRRLRRGRRARGGSGAPGKRQRWIARARADKPRHGCRRWRGSAATGGAPLPSGRRCRRLAAAVIGREREEGARLGEGGADRARAGGDADEVEQVAVLAGRGVGPLAGRRRAARGGRRASARGRRERRLLSSSARACGRAGGSGDRPPRRARRERRRRRVAFMARLRRA